MEENKIQKPIILEMEEVKTELVQLINNAIQVRQLPCYLLDTVLSTVCAQVRDGAKQELEMARQQMAQQNKQEGVA